VTQDSEQARQVQIAGTVAPMLSDLGLALIGLYLVIIGFDTFPPRLLDPLWMLTTASTLCNNVSIPLVGMASLHLAGALAPMNNQLRGRQTLFSRLALWASLGLLLLLPAIGYANWRGIRNVSTSNTQAIAQVKRNADRLFAAIESASTSKDLQLRLGRLQGPILPDSELNQPLPVLKKQAYKLVNQVLNQYLSSIPTPKSEAYTEIYKQSLRTAIMAVLAALASAALAWDPNSSSSLLRQLFNPDSPLIKGLILRPQQQISDLLKSFKAKKMHTEGRNALRRQTEDRARQQKQAKQEEDRRRKQGQEQQRKLRDRMERQRDKRP